MQSEDYLRNSFIMDVFLMVEKIYLKVFNSGLIKVKKTGIELKLHQHYGLNSSHRKCLARLRGVPLISQIAQKSKTAMFHEITE